MATHSRGNSQTKTISGPKELVQEAEDRAQALGLTFSRYVQHLIELDVHKRGDLVIPAKTIVLKEKKKSPPPRAKR